jgi:uncharacterized Zn finger protein (UPF0148 family)
MTYKIEALSCPNCGAPLDIRPNEEFTFCQYCDSSIRINKNEGTGVQSAVHTEIPKVVIEEVKKLLSSGDKAKAAELYMKAANVNEEEASKQIEAFLNSITNKIALRRPLSLKGIIVSTLFFLVLLTTAYALATGIASSGFVKIICWVVLSFMILNILSLSQSIILTIKYSTRKWNNATVLKYFLISQKKKLSFFKVLLEVTEPNGSTFRTETKIMMKTVDIAKLQEGKVIQVKYFPDEKDNVVASVQNLFKNS